MIEKPTKKSYETIKRDLSILIIDDDESVVRSIKRILQASNPKYYIESVSTVSRAIEMAKKTYWDTILIDLSLPWDEGGGCDPANGMRAIEMLRGEMKITAPVIAITGHDDREDLSDTVLDLGAYYFLTKPLRPKSLTAIVRNATTFQMSAFDGLTGLLNKFTFIERLKSEFERVRRKNQNLDISTDNCDDGKHSCISLLFLDGDKFKNINDTYSHLIGDQVLKKISSSFIDEDIYKFPNGSNDLLKYIIRPYDVASRFGGDEFAVFLPETNHHHALIVAKRIKDLIGTISLKEIIGEENLKNGNDSITLSLGIATYPWPNDVSDHEELISMADAAMYASKDTRKGHIFGYNADRMLVRLD
jgi:PleD family two-component response regulator